LSSIKPRTIDKNRSKNYTENSEAHAGGKAAAGKSAVESDKTAGGLTMRIAVCDDEKKIREMVAGRVRKLYPGAEVLSYGSGEALLSADPPDILLLDIQMPGMGGMETARELRRRERTARTPYGKTILIFLTALEEYVFDAFDVGAFHYLVKPFREEKLASVLENAAAQYREQQRGFCRTAEGAGRPLMVLSGGVHVKVLLEDIVYAEVFNRKVILHKTDEDNIRGLKHDMANHIMLLEELCAAGQAGKQTGENAQAESTEAAEYLARLKGQAEEAVLGIRSGSPVTDVLLREAGSGSTGKAGEHTGKAETEGQTAASQPGRGLFMRYVPIDVRI